MLYIMLLTYFKIKVLIKINLFVLNKYIIQIVNYSTKK